MSSEKDVMLFYKAVHEIYENDFEDYTITVFSNKTPIQQLIPNLYRSSESFYDKKSAGDTFSENIIFLLLKALKSAGDEI